MNLIEKKKIIKITLMALSVIFISGNFQTKAQKVSPKATSSKTTTTAKPQKANTKSPKITGWAIEVRSISSAFDAYIGFNSGGLSIVMPAMAMYNYAPNALTGGMQCKFDISDKLFREVQSVVAHIQPQKWQAGYGNNAGIALRVTITYHHQDDPSTVYETWWKGTSEMPDDLRQILQLKDKVSDDIKAQCQKAMK